MGELGQGQRQDDLSLDRLAKGAMGESRKDNRKGRRGLWRELECGRSQPSTDAVRSLSYDQTYACPACGSGELTAIALMDVFACDFCRHMFTANLQTQSVQLADSLPPMAWLWRAGRWRTAYQGDTAAPLIWAFCSGLTAMPVGLIALSNYIFPPLEGSNFPRLWIGLTLASHSVISTWLLSEYHRWPWYVSSKIRFQRFRQRWLSGG